MTARIGGVVKSGHADVYCRTCDSRLGYVERKKVVVRTDLTTGRQTTVGRWFAEAFFFEEGREYGSVKSDGGNAGFATRREALSQFTCLKCDRKSV